jgi:threonine 3-dehydrogenase
MRGTGRRGRFERASLRTRRNAVAADASAVYDERWFLDFPSVNGSAMQEIPATMLAIRKLRGQPGLDLCSDVPIPKLGPRDALIRVTHAGICGTDRHIYEWDRWSQTRIKPGITIGHEFVGQVVQVGPAVQRTSVGRRVCVEGHVGCQVCESCRTGNGHVCERVRILGIDTNGGFAQFVAVPEENIWHVHSEIRDEIAAIFDPLGNAVHTVMAAGVSGQSVLITGVGIIGLMAVTVAKSAGASRVLATDVDANRLELARRLGADATFLASDDWVPKVRAATDATGVHVLLEMSGNAQAIRGGLDALRGGGRAALLGIPANDVSLDLPRHVIFKGATILGITGRRVFETWYQMENLVLSGRLNLDPIITHVLPMREFESGFKMMQSGEAIKVVLKIPHPQDVECPAESSIGAAVS